MQILKPGYTMNGFNWHDQRGIEGIGFVKTLRTLLTLHLPRLTPGTRVIIDRTFAQEVKLGKSVNGKYPQHYFPGMKLTISSFDTLQESCHENQCLRVLWLGLLCVSCLRHIILSALTTSAENTDFIDAAYYYNEDVLYGSEILRMTPSFLEP
jgi:hypothetical protein